MDSFLHGRLWIMFHDLQEFVSGSPPRDHVRVKGLRRVILHFKLRSVTYVATKVHVILQSFVVLTWMRDTIDLV